MNYKHVIISRRGGPEVLQVVEDPLPEPRTGEVRVRILTAGVAFADVLMREGLYPDVPPVPFTPGYDIAGIVETPSQNFSPGQTVAALTRVGGYAEYINLPEASLVPAPANLDPAETVSLVLNYLTAYQMLHRSARVSTGDRILIHGAAGGVGTALLELGRLMRLEMYGTASSAKHELVTQLGGAPIDYQREDFVERIHALTGDGVDAVFDAVGGRQWARSYQAMRAGGRLVGYGFSAATSGGRRNLLQIISNFVRMPRFTPLSMLDANKAIMGFNVATLKEQRPEWYRADLATLIDLLAQQKIKPVIAQRIPLADAARAHELLGQAAVQGKIVLICGSRDQATT